MPKVVEYYEMNYSELESLVRERYGHEWSFVADEECGNDSEHAFAVKGELDKWDGERLEKFKQTGAGTFLAAALLEDLVRQGALRPGNYLIKVCW